MPCASVPTPTRALGEHIGRSSDDVVQETLNGIIDTHSLTTVLRHVLDYVSDYEVNHPGSSQKARALAGIAAGIAQAHKVSRERFDR